jgi:hypothetical protein
MALKGKNSVPEVSPISVPRGSLESMYVPLIGSASQVNPVEWMDGFLLGDGALALNKTGTKARAQIHVKHHCFAEFMMRGFREYFSCEPRSYNQGKSWTSYTRQSAELFHQYRRWYPDGRKRLPSDLRLTPASLLLWYLGDGMLSVREKKNSIEIRFANENFTQHELGHILLPRLEELGIHAAVTTERNIAVRIQSLRRFFALLGRTSPVACYRYKFAVPSWRFDTSSVKEVGVALGVDWRLINQYVCSSRLQLGEFIRTESGELQMLALKTIRVYLLPIFTRADSLEDRIQLTSKLAERNPSVKVLLQEEKTQPQVSPSNSRCMF